MKDAVQQAIEQLRQAHPGHRVELLEEPQGGAFVIVDDLPIGERFKQKRSWIGFALGFQYPLSDVYPHFLRPDLERADGRPLASPLNPSQTMPGFERPAVMLSRRSNRWNPARDTAVLKLARVVEWLRNEA
jgi:hypothetical protein